MGLARTPCGWLGTLLVLSISIAIGCSGRTSSPQSSDSGGGQDAAGACADASVASKAAGQTCACASECASGFCADGVCCQTACGEACKSCGLPGTAGSCVSRPAGAAPREAAACMAALAATCGSDGTCDGAGACRNHRAGTPCKTGRCDGDAVVSAYACDGDGLCKPAPTIICAPFSCNAADGRCFDTCTVSSQCIAGQQCTSSSCGKKMTGASCAAGDQCATGFCADGLCCNVACQGGCVACNLPGREGICSAIDVGAADPHGVCRDQGAASCGTTGLCGMFGTCAKYPAATQCVAPSCAAGNRLNPARTCDGLGACGAARPQSGCSPFRCVDGACTTGCTTSADCDAGRICENGSCGPKPDGLTCAAGAECRSGSCVDGVCCESACAGGCRSCALPSTLGRCTPIAPGNLDTRGVCHDDGAAACGNNGRCDGNNGCQRYAANTTCRAESCAAGVYTPVSTCDGTGGCVTPATRLCTPFVCNGARCFGACTTPANCEPPNVCNGSSCGKKLNGAACSDGGECGSGVCVQGICCNTPCGGACKSCALPASLGTCSNVIDGAVDPQGTCAIDPAASCGRVGVCDGAGACRRYPAGTQCAGPMCAATDASMLASARTCDGAGTCRPATTSPCAPFKCDGAAACRGACDTDGHCVDPNICDPATKDCVPKQHLGQMCDATGDCLTGNFCVDGVCCQANCQDQGETSCGTDGHCDAAGTCTVYSPETMCAGPSCPADTSAALPARFCDGGGTCAAAATSTDCFAYRCDGNSACRTMCADDTQCTPPSVCDTMAGTCGS